MAKHRARVTNKGGVTTVKAIISHPMETGLRKDKATGKKIPAHFIQEMVIKHNATTVLTALMGPAVSKNPLINFTFKGGKSGDKIVFSWDDNKGMKDSFTTTIR